MHLMCGFVARLAAYGVDGAALHGSASNIGNPDRSQSSASLPFCHSSIALIDSRSLARLWYVALKSRPIYERSPSNWQAIPVVPLPLNGSKTIAFVAGALHWQVGRRPCVFVARFILGSLASFLSPQFCRRGDICIFVILLSG